MNRRLLIFSIRLGGWMAVFGQGADLLLRRHNSFLAGRVDDDFSFLSSIISRGGGADLIMGALAASNGQAEEPMVSLCTYKPDADSIRLTLDESHKSVYFKCGTADTAKLSLAPSSLNQAYSILNGECATSAAVGLDSSLPTATLKPYKNDQGWELSVESLPTDADKSLCFACVDGSSKAHCKVMITAKKSTPQPAETCVNPPSIHLDAQGNSSLTFHCGSKYSELDPIDTRQAEGGSGSGLEYVNTNAAQCDAPNRLDTVLPGATLQVLSPPSPPYSNVWKSYQLNLKDLPKKKQQLCYRCKNSKGDTCDVLIQVSAKGDISSPTPPSDNSNTGGGDSAAYDSGRRIDSALRTAGISILLLLFWGDR
ncbi:sag-related sequence srs44 [Cystoisospora suis]|uniref:Sag-related sequence srs44 n=1 Tax=Cystoisospora suis TaxID=483139 RepID=A0A2C6KJZ9_9APIC|nr:sag-related sequence srs44 [Cystoisospora suis]